jgi:mannan endo-1,4-beta-mannosidase
MISTRLIVVGLSTALVVGGAVAGDLSVGYTINTQVQRAPISSYIYGSNPGLSGDENLAARRSGGNRLTGYNWENNFSNAGNDWYHHSDRYLVRNLPTSQQLVPGIVQTRFHDSALAAGQLSVVTLQMAGFVAADDDGTVEEADTAPSERWKQAVYVKGSAFCDPAGEPDTGDDYVFMDECVNFLVARYGNASTPTGVKCYSLDNEPGLWASTHPRIHPEKVGCEELVNRSVSLSRAVKDVDPYAQILGPVLYGFNAYLSLQDAPDWDDLKGDYDWFIDYYLDLMKRSDGRDGRRTLDVLDLHWYPEARGDGARITESQSAYSRANADARMQAPRTLWDPDYTEDSWIAKWFSGYLPLLPNIVNSIETYYPGTKLSITEYSYGAADHISGGVAMADVLGIFGKYGLYLSTYWHLGGDYDYVSAAYRIYRNYDGANSTFGDTKV